MVKAGKEFSSGTSYFGKERHERRDAKIIDDPNYVCYKYVSKVQKGIRTLKNIDKKLKIAITDCKSNGYDHTKKLETLLEDHIPKKRAQDESYIKARKACFKDLTKLMDGIDTIENKVNSQEIVRDYLQEATLQTTAALYRSGYRKKFIPLYKKHIQRLASLLKIPCFQGDEDHTEKATLKLKSKFKDFRDLCKKFLIPFGHFASKPYLCTDCDMIGFIAHKTVTDKRYQERFKSLSDIFVEMPVEEEVESINNDYLKYLEVKGLDSTKDKKKIGALVLPSIQLPGSREEKSWHPCLTETEQEIGSSS